jgi:GR25 family glycosyltransferase involved in LPS biosynthesis
VLIPKIDKIFVLSLHTRVDRRKRIGECLDSMGLPFEVFDAIDARRLRLKTEVTSPYLHCPENPDGFLLPGRVGAFLSRIALYRECLRKNYGNVMVIEDDTVFADDFITKASLAIEALPENWDLLYFGCWDWDGAKATIVNEHLIRPGKPVLEHCVLFSSRLIPHLVDDTRTMRETSDLQLMESCAQAQRFACRSPLAWQNDSRDSDA